jgi:Polyphosphate kinase 2 (PPK2)
MWFRIAMLELEQIYRVERRRGIIALEGWDASGKGGAVQRLTEKLDPRWVHVWSIGPPSPEEQGRLSLSTRRPRLIRYRPRHQCHLGADTRGTASGGRAEAEMAARRYGPAPAPAGPAWRE